jgi:cyclopropane-fatty-acyl-phospholipid synthase
VNLVETLAEAGALPDSLIRAWIRAQLNAGHTPAPIARATTPGQPPLELPPAFFEPWLGPHMKLSCGRWPTPATTLAESEEAMLALTCERARLAKGMRVLDLGAGFGGLTLWIAGRDPTARVLALSNSEAETAHIRARAAERGITNVSVERGEARTFETGLKFDRIFAIELFGHLADAAAVFERTLGCLGPDGRLFVQALSGPGSHRGEFEPLQRWPLDPGDYVRTIDAWLARADGLRAGRPGRRWRVLLLASAETFARPGASGWTVEHALYAARGARARVNATPLLPGGLGKP